MATTLKIDFVSDIACPWCAVGLGALEQALGQLKGEVQANLHFQPFELNPNMGPGGQDLGEHLTLKEIDFQVRDYRGAIVPLLAPISFQLIFEC